jgi:hypothetical protein
MTAVVSDDRRVHAVTGWCMECLSEAVVEQRFPRGPGSPMAMATRWQCRGSRGEAGAGVAAHRQKKGRNGGWVGRSVVVGTSLLAVARGEDCTGE